MDKRYERIQSIINKHNRRHLSIYTNSKLKLSICTIFYGDCEIKWCDWLDRYELDFYRNGEIIMCIDLTKIEYDMQHHELYIKGE